MTKYKHVLIPFIIILIFFTVCLGLSSAWNQFYPIGERIRDYALLVEQSKNLFGFDEPWMSGTTAHYYLFWYKIGGLIGKIFGLSGENNYLVLLNFCWTLYFSVIYFFVHKIFKQGYLFSALSAVLILFSSNFAGMKFALDASNRDWWNISRVIEGAITEFPAWSYLLADLHPHLMNFCLPPLFLLLGHRLLNSDYAFKQKALLLFLLCLFFVSVFLNANPWDAIAIAVLAGFLFIAFWKARNQVATRKVSKVLIGFMLLGSALFLFLKPQMKAYVTLRFVQAPIQRTDPASFFQHWGLWLVFIAVSSALVIYEKKFAEWKRQYWILGASVLSFWLLPEIVFLDDAYIFPNERMNFIFKIYSFTWVFVGLWFISLLSMLTPQKSWVVLILALIPSLLFFHKAYGLRTEELQGAAHPLDTAERNFPNTKAAILKFKELPEGITIQAANAAYDYTSFIGTMSDKKLYLGWPNHMSLLSGDYVVVNERINVIDSIYKGEDCAQKKQTMQTIGARYIVLSAQEFKVYPQLNIQSFSCFERVAVTSSVLILSL